MEDKRFKHIATDPKFRRIPKGEQKVKIDKRFQSMFKDKQFKVKYTTDKRGRPINRTSTEDLRRYYDLSSEDESTESESEDDEENETDNTKKTVPNDEEQVNDLKTKHKSDKTLSEDIKKKLKNLNVDYARGETAFISDSSSDDEESDELSEDETIEHKWGELDADAGSTDETTYRLAACNMDWDRIRAVDLMVLLNSFLPAGGMIKSVAIYPSEFGKARLKEEEIKGPIELVESKETEEDGDKNEEGSGYHMEKLRQYQLNRLKYYYCVICFDSPGTANKVYSECDGMEYESSAVKLDLRFIPDDMEFDDEPKEFCDKLPEVNKYQPRFFTTTALQQAKVDLTWDETNPDRLEFAQKLSSGKLEDIPKDDLQNYLASSSGEEDNENENSENSEEETGGNVIDKYKALLLDIEDKEKSKKDNDIEMEISWETNIKEKTEKLIKEKLKTEEKTPFQQYLEKRKDKRKQKREERKQKVPENDDSNSDSDIPSDIDLSNPYFAEEFNKPEFKKKSTKKKDIKKDDEDSEQNQAELELLLMNENDSKKNFSLKKIQEREKVSKKKKNKKQVKNDDQKDDFQINVADERFSALFTSHHYNIDPTDSHFKKTKAMDILISEKLKKRSEEDSEDIRQVKKPKVENRKKAELNMLVKSVKNKSKDFKRK